MHFSKVLFATVFAALAAAQGDSQGSQTSGDMASSTSSGDAPSGSVMMHVVKVSNKDGALTFSPDNIQAKVGEMVQFHFYPKNHSVVQASFDKPCEPMDNGFFSGYMPVKASDTQMPVYTIEVKDTKPMWFYCSQGKHCQGGMVGVINQSGTEKTLEKWKSASASASSSGSPSSSGSGGSSSSGSDSSGYGSSGSDSSTMTTSVATGAGSSPTASNSTAAPAGSAASPSFNSAATSSIAIFLAAIVSVLLF